MGADNDSNGGQFYNIKCHERLASHIASKQYVIPRFIKDGGDHDGIRTRMHRVVESFCSWTWLTVSVVGPRK